jgi:transcriptional regulator with XRE-family HTH domain
MAGFLVPITLTEIAPLDPQAVDQAVDAVRRSISEFRVLRGWNQKELAQRAGVREATISKVKSGDQGMRLGTLIQLAHGLQVPASVLLMTPRMELLLREIKDPRDPKTVAR